MSRAAEPVDALGAVRAIDWRFLLPEPFPARVAVIGGVDPAVAAAFRAEGAEVLENPGNGRGHRASVDLAVVERGDRPTIAAAAELLRSGGAVRIVRAGVRGTGSPPGLGFGPSLRILAWPGAARPTELALADGPTALRWSLDRRRGARGRAVRVLGNVATALGLADRVGPSVGRVAVRDPEGSAVPAPGLAGLVAGLGSEALGPDPAVLLLTPRFRASRHVVALVGPRDAEAPKIVAKLPRRAGDADGLEREADALAALRDAGAAAAGPAVIGRATAGGRPILVEAAVPGHPLDPATVRADPAGTVALGLAWLGTLPRVVADGRAPTGIVEQAVAACDVLRADPRAAGVLEAAAARVRRLAPAGLPAVFEHGDAGHPNLIVTGPGRIVAIDWELARPRGLPGHDAAFFLAYVAGARARAVTPSAHARAAADAFRPGGWATEAFRSALERDGLAPDLAPALIVATWLRKVADLATRLAPPDPLDGTAGGGPANAISAVLDSRHWAILEAVIRAMP